MTRPTSRLDWFPDPVDSLALRAAWFGAGWHYRIDWGDGKTQDVAFWQPPVRHVYPKPGRYTIVATSQLSSKVTASVEVTLRTTLHPAPVLELIPDTNLIRATLEHHDDNVQYRVDWGDGTSTTHDATDLTPQHDYPWGFGAPSITVVDQPARRSVTVIGPEIPELPEPEKTVGSTWHVIDAKTGRGQLRLFGMPPRAEVQLGRAGITEAAAVTTDGTGTARREYQLWQGDAAVYDGSWRSISIRWTDQGGVARQRWQPVRICDWIGGPTQTDPNQWICWTPGHYPSPLPPQCDIPVEVDWNIGSPAVITLRSALGPNGIWTVAWGDGKTEKVTVANQRFEATHDYGKYGSYWAVVTDPEGKKGRRRLRPLKPLPQYWKDGSLAIFQEYEVHGNKLGEILACDCYSVMRVDCGDGRPLYQVHRPSGYCSDRSGNGFSYATPGTYKVTMYGPMTDPITYTHVQKTRGMRDGVFDITEQSPPSSPLSHTFHPDALKPTYYTAFFRITNASDVPAPWQLEFTLDNPAVLTDIYCWRGEATKTDLGNQRWRITGSHPVIKGDPTRLDITVDPCGNPRVWPSDIQLTTPSTTLTSTQDQTG